VFTADQSIKNASGASALTITGNEAAAASLILSSDDGDDLSDVWTQTATAGNLLAWTNGGVSALSINNNGTMTVTATEASSAQLVLNADEADDANDVFVLQSSGNAFAIIGSTGQLTVSAAGLITTTDSIELANASDTTIARVSAGVVSIEGANILTTGSALVGASLTIASHKKFFHFSGMSTLELSL